MTSNPVIRMSERTLLYNVKVKRIYYKIAFFQKKKKNGYAYAFGEEFRQNSLTRSRALLSRVEADRGAIYQLQLGRNKKSMQDVRTRSTFVSSYLGWSLKVGYLHGP
jgi:hypothetical protein